MNKPIQAAKTLRGLFYNHPERWTQGAFARAKNENPIGWNSRYAASFCLSGALRRIYPLNKQAEVRERLRKVIKRDLVNFNDSMKTKFEDILRVVRKAKV